MNQIYSGPDRCQRYTTTSELCELAEIIAKNVHEVWAAGRLAEGWKYGSERMICFVLIPVWCLMRNCPKTEKKITTAGQPMETLKIDSENRLRG